MKTQAAILQRLLASMLEQNDARVVALVPKHHLWFFSFSVHLPVMQLYSQHPLSLEPRCGPHT